jgi:hypothetical protein
MKNTLLFLCLLLWLAACENTAGEGERGADTAPSLQVPPSQELSYNNLLKKLSGSTDMQANERLRFLMVDKKRELLHFFSIQKKDQEYTLGAEYQVCTQVGSLRQIAYDESCKDLYQDEYSNLDQLLRSILENPRHDQKDEGEQEFYFQHFSMKDAVVYGTDQDVFALELYLAMLRYTQASEELIREYVDKKNALVGF